MTWHGCSTGPDDATGLALDQAGAQCTEVTVPLDYRRPAGPTIAIAIARRAATEPSQGTLVVNVGGPEASRQGVNVFLGRSPELAAQYDLVGIDPRFFGLSTPLECGWRTDRYLRSAQYASPTRAAFADSVSVARDLAAQCESHRDVLPYASTRNIARDMDRVRAALGVRQLSYFGTSYGTYLGAVYLQMFPGNADRVVLDSSHAPDTYGPRWTRETAVPDAAALADWAEWAARHDTGLGTTKNAVLATVDRIAAVTRKRPLQVGTHQVTEAMLPGLLLTVDDTDASYGEMSAAVRVYRDAAAGLPVTPTPLQEQRFGLYDLAEVVPEFGFSAGVANQCADWAAPRDPEVYYRDIRAHRLDEPLFGPLARDISPCTFWPTTPIEAPTTIANDHRVLMLGATGDPAVPYSGQLAMHRALRGSRLITLSGAFRHGVYGVSPCVDATVERYLGQNTLPAADVTCT
ncbi:alpha/beta hydrolase [Kribbella albertanoniae]|uniref:alpha/beta hydrolase n=1 Tax=Kribbella albertanoniae TaxID=1266829 RepID=UPI00192DD4C6|nr:alpha/beta hydrolase [Kribbella albertanoniae]